MVEILPVRHLTTIPQVKMWLRGLIPYRTEIYPVTDLSAFLTNQMTTITDQARIMVTKQHEEYFGLLVDEVRGIEYFSQETIQARILPLLFYQPYLTGTLVKEHQELPILSLKTLVKQQAFRDVALRSKVVSSIEE